MATFGIIIVIARVMMIRGADRIWSFWPSSVAPAAFRISHSSSAGQIPASPDANVVLAAALRSSDQRNDRRSGTGWWAGVRAVSDKMKIGRSMDAALQDTADRLGTPEFQFFVISIAIQRETGGNLAETLSNLATVLRQRSQMKLKIKAMASESKASAYIVGSLPFIVFGLIMWISPGYMGNFSSISLIVAGIGGFLWMALGGLIMAKMVNFEI